MENKEQLQELHSENLEWLKNLVFYADEIKNMQSRIEEIARENTSRSVMPKIDHFENQLQIQKNEYNHLKHAIKNNEKLINEAMSNTGGSATQIFASDHSNVREKVIIFEKIINDLRLELDQFLQLAM